MTELLGPVSDRRTFLVRLGGFSAALIGGPISIHQALAAQVQPGQKLKPGDFTWTPDAAPSGQVAIVVSIPDQLVTVYRGGTVIAVSTCSTGKPGHDTPTGTFTILQKARVHYSSTYDDAPMPNMERLTWSGIALHAGKLPGYPASHGCVRLPLEFSALLFTVTHVGTTVTITTAHTAPPVVKHQGMVLAGHDPSDSASISGALQGATASSTRTKVAPPIPRANPTPPAAAATKEAPLLAVVISSADKKIAVFDHDEIVAEGKATIADADIPLGSHVFILEGGDSGGLTWHVLSYAAEPGAVIPEADAELLRRITGDKSVIEAMKARMHPGMVLITTDDPITPDTITDDGFTIMADDGRPISQR